MAPNTTLDCDPQAAAEFLRALAHPTRLQILCRLLDGEAAVSAFESELGLKQPNLSQQLGQLREAGLVTTRREAKSIFYSLSDAKVRTILDALRDAFGTHTDSVQPPMAGQHAQPPLAGQHPQPPLAGQHAQRPLAGQRLTVLASVAASKASPTPAPQTRPEGECGVFSIAGWDIAPTATTKGKRDPNG